MKRSSTASSPPNVVLILAALMLAPPGVMRAADLYVAPNGDDANPGTEAQPFARVPRAQADAAPGDTVFIRGGTYVLREDEAVSRGGLYVCLARLDKSGRPGARINYRAYPGEHPVFDLSAVKPPRRRVAAFHVTGSWIHLQGLEVRGVQVTITGHTQSICFYNDGSHNVYERLAMHDGQAIGIYSVNGASNLFLNCDAWNNRDATSEDGKGGNVDGFGCHPPPGSAGNVFRGCRAWYNSDDGFDCIGAVEPVTFEDCWAFFNGLSPAGEKLADGNGFKAGGYGRTPSAELPSPIPRHVIRGCLAVGNRSSGFYANHHPGGCDWFNNSAFDNGINFNFLGRLPGSARDAPGSGHRIRNNVSYRSRGLVASFRPEANEADHNTFAPARRLDDRDFVSLDKSQLTGPRGAGGALPVITLLHPADGSVLVDGGIDVGRPFRGAAPDLGAFER
jgi:hypothetical protein